jgi:hypothetical protein
MFRSIFAASLVILAMLIAAGCSDDNECPNCPTNVDTVTVTETVTDTLPVTSAKVLVSGYCRIEDGILDPWIEIYSVDSDLPQVDSIRCAGELVPIEMDYDSGTPNVQLDDELPGDTWESGDVFEVVVYTPEGNGTCNLTMLDYDTDAPVIIDWPVSYPYDTVEVSTEIVVSWSPVADADWYNYSLGHQYDSAGQRQSTYTRGYTSGTSFTIPANDNGFDGYWSISVYSISGPYPEDADGNFAGSDAVKGVLLSYSYEDLNIYVGTGNPGPWTVSKAVVPDDAQGQIVEILKGFRDK